MIFLTLRYCAQVYTLRMKIFCSYSFTGEEYSTVQQRMSHVVGALKKSGHDPYCLMFDPSDDSPHRGGDAAAALRYAIAKMESCDCVAVIVSSDRRSEGQLIEIGAAEHLCKPIYLFQHHTATGKSYLPQLAAVTRQWHKLEDLEQTLSSEVFEPVTPLVAQGIISRADVPSMTMKMAAL